MFRLLRKAARRTGAFIVGWQGVIVQLILGALIAWVTSGMNLPDLGLDGTGTFLAYTVIFTAMLLGLVFMFNLAAVYGEQVKFADLKALAEMRSKGIDLWNQIMPPFSEEKVPEAINMFKAWREETYQVFLDVHEVRAEQWSRAGEFRAGGQDAWNKGMVNDEHRHVVYLWRHMWMTLGEHIDQMNENMEDQ